MNAAILQRYLIDRDANPANIRRIAPMNDVMAVPEMGNLTPASLPGR
jgi:hypothetical protein